MKEEFCVIERERERERVREIVRAKIFMREIERRVD